VTTVVIFVSGFYLYRFWRIEQFARKCRLDYRFGNWTYLQKDAESWVQFNPRASDGYFYLMEASHHLRRPQDVVRYAELIAPDSTHYRIALIRRMNTEFFDLNQPLTGVQTANSALVSEPRLAEAHRMLIFFYALTDQPEKLMVQVQQAVRQGSEPVEGYVYLMLAAHLYFTNGPSLNEKWLRSSPESELFITAREVQFAETEVRSQKLNLDPLAVREERRQQILELCRQYPQNLRLRRYLLRDYAQQHNVQQVESILAQAPPEAVGDCTFWQYRGWYHKQLQEIGPAQNAYERSLEILPFNWLVWHELAEVLRLSGDVDRAEIYEKRSLFGKELRAELLRLPDARSVTDPQLEAISIYCRECGEPELAERIEQRLIQRNYPGQGPLPDRLRNLLPYRWSPDA